MARQASAQALPFDDRMVQAPALAVPGPASLAGDLATFSSGARSLASGAFQMPMPFSLPGDRAPLLANIVPSYRPGRGLTEWGMGFGLDLAIQRSRRLGNIDYTDDDELVSPWGRLVPGNDGAYYPAGLEPAVRIEPRAEGWYAVDPAGLRYTFDRAQRTEAGVYAWYLTAVEGLHGEFTSLAWDANPSGRQFLSSVEWGRDGVVQHQVTLQYEQRETTFVDYRSGSPVWLDRRVDRVTLNSRGSSGLALQYYYQLRYESDEAGLASYLVSVQKTYRSGQTHPPLSYRYGRASDALSAASFAQNTRLAEYVTMAGDAALEPKTISVTDIDRDSRLDFEHQYARVLVHQRDNGFVLESLPAPPANALPACGRKTSFSNTPRTLARLRPDDGEPLVLASQSTGAGQTDLITCTRNGDLVTRRAYDGNWALGPNTRLTDLDNDRRPDLVRVVSGEYRVLRNVSTSAQVGFEATEPRTLSAASLTATWVQDMNGDGLPDLVGLTRAGFVVWYGRGNTRFESAGVLLQMLSASGTPLSRVSDWAVTFVDHNRDGMMDVLLSRARSAFLFLNRGSYLAEQALPARLSGQLSEFSGTPFIGDLDGSGEVQLTIVKSRIPYTARLGAPNVGLLIAADDGKGTRLSFEYGRAPAHAGLEGRGPVLLRMDVEKSGHRPETSEFAYAAPAVHAVAGLLLGFDRVTERLRDSETVVQFDHDDDLPPVIAELTERDARIPGLERFEWTTHAEDVFRGVRLRHAVLSQRGYRDAAGVEGPISTVETLRYERGVCATETRTTTTEGVLTAQEVLDSPSGLRDALHCLPHRSTLSGAHVHGSQADFTYGLEVVRQPTGEVTEQTSLAPGQRLGQRRVTYDAAGRMVQVTQPGYGSATFDYDASGRLVKATTADGVVSSVSEFDPITDQIRRLKLTRGGEGFIRGFVYDALDRLESEYDSLRMGNLSTPTALHEYAYATANTLATHRRRAFFATDSVDDTVALMASDGKSVASGRRIGSKFDIGEILELDGDAIRRYRGPAREHAPVSVDTLLARADFVGGEEQALGLPLFTEQVFGQDARGERAWSYAVQANHVVATEVVNGTYRRVRYLDSAGRAVHNVDELGSETRISYDLLGRVREVKLPSGATHGVQFDAFGRVHRIARDGVGSVVYGYDGEGRLAQEDWTDAKAKPVRSLILTRDALGRVTRARYAGADGATEEVRYARDGRSLDAPTEIPDQRGQLTQVEAGAYQRGRRYDAAGRLLEETTDFAGWRRVERRFAYYANDSTQTEATTVTDQRTGKVLHQQIVELRPDAFGRLSSVVVNGKTVMRLGWDPDHYRLANVTTDAGASYTFDYDATTQALSGKAMRHQDGWTSAASWRFDARGRVASEVAALGQERSQRNYRRDAAGRLLEVSGAEQAHYGYDEDGLIGSSDDALSARQFDRAAETAHGIDVALDGMKRIVRLGDAKLGWSPRGDLASVTRGDQVWSYLYDEDGTRVARLENGNFKAAFLGGQLLTENHLVSPVRVSGMLLGVLVNGGFTPLASDGRGTVIGDADGLMVPTAYGVRVASLEDPVLAEALDFVEGGRDPILGTIRMGVRDYLPELGQFLTFDPLYFTDLARCAGTLTECNLFGYASGDPLTFFDPQGTDPKTALPEYPTLDPMGNPINRYEGDTVPRALVFSGGAAIVGIGLCLATQCEVWGPALAAANFPWVDRWMQRATNLLAGMNGNPTGGGSSGAAAVADDAASGAMTVADEAAQAAEVHVLEGANYAQKTFGRMFSDEGKFAGKSVEDVAEALRSGALKAAEVPVDYIVREGNTLILNTRSAQALTQAGIPRSLWTAVNRTGQELFETMLTGQLTRNKLTSAGIETVRQSAGKK